MIADFAVMRGGSMVPADTFQGSTHAATIPIHHPQPRVRIDDLPTTNGTTRGEYFTGRSVSTRNVPCSTLYERFAANHTCVAFGGEWE
jgi:hypothetical protein